MDKKEKKKREPSEWNKACAKVRALPENKGKKASEIFKITKETYKK